MERYILFEKKKLLGDDVDSALKKKKRKEKRDARDAPFGFIRDEINQEDSRCPWSSNNKKDRHVLPSVKSRE